jgi:hypothetical protein
VATARRNESPDDDRQRRDDMTTSHDATIRSTELVILLGDHLEGAQLGLVEAGDARKSEAA